MNKTSLWVVIVGVAAIVAVSVLIVRTSAKTVKDSFAQCLAAQGATMYGAESCSHCQKQKKAFGNAFRFIRYVECPDNPTLCTEQNIDGFPTWTFANGKRLVGEQSMQQLAEASGCPLPE